jgi:hypothetical protein
MRKPLREKEGWTAVVAIGSRKKMNEQVAGRAYKGRNGIRIGTMTISKKLDAE